MKNYFKSRETNKDSSKFTIFIINKRKGNNNQCLGRNIIIINCFFEEKLQNLG